MDDRVDGVLCKYRLHRVEIRQVAIFERDFLPDNGLNSTDCFSRGIVKIVKDDSIVSRLDNLDRLGHVSTGLHATMGEIQCGSQYSLFLRLEERTSHSWRQRTWCRRMRVVNWVEWKRGRKGNLDGDKNSPNSCLDFLKMSRPQVPPFHKLGFRPDQSGGANFARSMGHIKEFNYRKSCLVQSQQK